MSKNPSLREGFLKDVAGWAKQKIVEFVHFLKNPKKDEELGANKDNDDSSKDSSSRKTLKLGMMTILHHSHFLGSTWNMKTSISNLWHPNSIVFSLILMISLYPQSSGLSKQCAKNIEEYMIQKLGIDEAQVPEMNRVLYKNYGTSMAGLQAIGYEFDNDDYHNYVHGRLPYQNLKPDHVLRSLLLNLPFRKIIFTNADKAHVAKSLSILGLEDCFEMIICFETLNPKLDGDDKISAFKGSEQRKYVFSDESALPETPIVCKPFEDAFQQAFQIANINPQRTLFFEDSIRNLQTGKHLGLHTVLVGTCQRPKGVDYAVESIHNIREAIPELWEIDAKAEKKSYAEKMAIETSVTA